MQSRSLFLCCFLIPLFGHNFAKTDEGDILNLGQDDNTNMEEEEIVNKADPKNCECGQPNKIHKIVGGQVTIQNEYPWMVSLHDSVEYRLRGADKSHFCGGTLISNRWVITAAHCTSDYVWKPFLLKVALGRHNLADPNDSTFAITKNAIAIKIHPRYNRKTQDNDVSLVRLLIPSVKFSDVIRPVCFSDVDGDFTGQQLIVAGWGSTSEGGPTSPLLMDVQVPAISNAECEKLYKKTGIVITDNMLCAVHPQGGMDSCQGDSGGPLMQHCGDRHSLEGIVSFGIGCAQKQYPGVYTRVSKIKAWVKRVVGANNLCQNRCQPNANSTSSNSVLLAKYLTKDLPPKQSFLVENARQPL